MLCHFSQCFTFLQEDTSRQTHHKINGIVLSQSKKQPTPVKLLRIYPQHFFKLSQKTALCFIFPSHHHSTLSPSLVRLSLQTSFTSFKWKKGNPLQVQSGFHFLTMKPFVLVWSGQEMGEKEKREWEKAREKRKERKERGKGELKGSLSALGASKQGMKWGKEGWRTKKGQPGDRGHR